MIEISTTPGKTYAVTSKAGCTVTTEEGLTLAEVEAGKQGYFVSVGGKVIVDDDAAIVTEVFNAALIAASASSAGGGNGGGSSTGEKVVFLSETELTMKHATWFDNAEQSAIAVHPGTWKNEVMSCYLKTDMPVKISGVTWLYGEPAMMEGFTFVVALQQIDADTVLANLAYSIKR